MQLSKLLAAVLIASAASVASAGAVYENKIQYCTAKGSIFQNSADIRNMGRSPKDALDVARGFESTGNYAISQEYIKRAINLVFFDPGFTNAGGMALQQQVMNDCMRDGKPKYQSLK